MGNKRILAVLVVLFVVFILLISIKNTEDNEVLEPVAVKEVTEVVNPEASRLLSELNEKVDTLNRDMAALLKKYNNEYEEEVVSIVEPEPEVIIESEEVGFMNCGNGQTIPNKGYLGSKVAPCGGLYLAPSADTKLRSGVYKLDGGSLTVH